MNPLRESDSALNPIRVVVLEGDDRSRQMLIDRLEQIDGIVVVGDGRSVAGALAIVRASGAEVVIADARLADGSGDEVCRRLRIEGQRCGCVLLAGLPPRRDGSTMVGVDAVVLKELVGDTLEREIRTVGAAVRSEPGKPVAS